MRIFFTILIVFVCWSVGLSQQGLLVDRNGEVKENVISIYPNPAKDFMALSIVNNNLNNVAVHVYNIIGSKMNVKIDKERDGLYAIDLRELTAGYYLLVIKDDQAKFNKTYKFIKRE